MDPLSCHHSWPIRYPASSASMNPAARSPTRQADMTAAMSAHISAAIVRLNGEEPSIASAPSVTPSLGLTPSAAHGPVGLGTVFREASGFEHVADAAKLQKFLIKGDAFIRVQCEYSTNYTSPRPRQETEVHLYIASGGQDGEKHIIGVDRQTMTKMQHDWSLPAKMFEQLQPRVGYFSMSHTVQYELQQDKSELKPRYINLAITDFGYSFSTWAFFFRHDLRLSRTFCLCLLCDSDQGPFETEVRKVASDLQVNAMFLPYLMVKQQALSLSLKQPNVWSFKMYYDFAQELGMSPGSRTTAEFTQLMKNMYGLSLNVNEYCASGETLVRTVDTLERLGKLVNGDSGLEQVRSVLDLQERLEVLRSDLKDQVSQLRSYNGIIQTQFSVLYSSISQRDNKQNLRLAQATREISKATRIDGSSMKIIAAVTLVFLPVTSVSTVFSTTFVNASSIRKYWPLYLVLCVALTIASLAVWRQLMRRTMKNEKSKDVEMDSAVSEGSLGTPY